MQRSKYFLFFSSIIIFFLFFLAPLDTDLGWHLRYGEYVVKTWHFLQTNTLTYYLEGYYWANSYTLYQIIAYFIYKFFGLIGFNFACALVMSAGYCLFCLTNLRFAKINFFLFLCLSFFSWQIFNLGFRSQLFSFLFTVLTFYILDKSENNPKSLYILPPIFFIWANLHGAFAFGLFILVVFLLDKIIYHKEKGVLTISLVFFISFLSTLLNPYGIGVYREGLTHITYPLGSLIAEWVPPNLTYCLVIAFLLIFTFISLLVKNAGKKAFWFIIVTTFAIFAFTARRNIPLLGLAFAECFIFTFHDKLAALENNQKFTEFSIIALIVIAILYISLGVLPGSVIMSVDSTAYCNDRFIQYPCQAVSFLKQKGVINENIFANYEWGGYLEWALPNDKFFVDGRMPTWKTPENLSPYTVYLNVIQAQPDYEATLDKYKTDVLLMGAGSFLDLELKNNKSVWQEVYRDGTSVVYFRRLIK